MFFALTDISTIGLYRMSAREPNDANYLTLNLPDGVKIVLFNNVNEYLTYVILEQDDWFESEIKFVRKFLKPGMSALDIGANAGLYTLTMAQHVGSSGYVLAFEPTQKMVDLLKISININNFSNIDVVCAALSDKTGISTLINQGHSVVNNVVDYNDTIANGSPVKTYRLDEVAISTTGKQFDFVKIDTEGSEPLILAGASSFLKYSSPVIMAEVKHGNTVDLSIVEILENYSYSTYRHLESLNCLVPFQKNDQADGFLLNLFFVKPDRAEVLCRDGLLVKHVEFTENTYMPPNWSKVLQTLPYASGLIAQWREYANGSPYPGWKAYEKVLDQYLASRNEELAPTHRYALLQSAYSKIGSVINEYANVGRLITAARILLDYGHRAAAVNLIQIVLKAIADGVETIGNEPFVLLRNQDEQTFSSEELSSGLAHLLYRDDQLLGRFTGLVSPPVNRLESLGHRFISKPLERMLYLSQFRNQSSISVPPSILADATSDNINADIWRSIINGQLVLNRF